MRAGALVAPARFLRQAVLGKCGSQYLDEHLHAVGEVVRFGELAGGVSAAADARHEHQRTGHGGGKGNGIVPAYRFRAHAG